MAAMYGGEPLPLEDVPQFQPSALGPSLYTLGNARYRIGDKSITIYSFDHDASVEDHPNHLLDDYLIDDSMAYTSAGNARVIPGIPPESAEEAQYQIAHVEEIGESSAENAATAGDDSPAAALGGGTSGAAAAGPSSSSTPAPPADTHPLAYWAVGSSGSVPENAVLVGLDLDSGPLFVGRACVYGELLPGKVATHHRVCYVASEGRELAYEQYEVLVLKRGRVEWVRGQNGSFPFDAFPAGLTLQDQRVYVARARVNDVLTPGRLVVGENECRISYDMKEFKFPEYEILTVKYMEPDENGMVRYVSAEKLNASEQSGRRFKPPNWCGTRIANMAGEIDEYPGEDEMEEEEVEEEEEEESDSGGVRFKGIESDSEEEDEEVAQESSDDQIIFME